MKRREKKEQKKKVDTPRHCPSICSVYIDVVSLKASESACQTSNGGKLP
jgi:hypothetical protein